MVAWTSSDNASFHFSSSFCHFGELVEETWVRAFFGMGREIGGMDGVDDVGKHDEDEGEAHIKVREHVAR